MNRGRILLITGASSDIGMDLMKKISENYEYIWAHYFRSGDGLGKLQEELGGKLLPVQADLSDRESTQQLIKKIREAGKLPDHIVHLPAPKSFNQKFHKCTWEDYQYGIDVSLRSIVMILKEFLPEMVKKRYGKIVLMLTAYVIGVPPKFQSPYITVKYGLLGLMRNLAAEYAGKGITVNGVSPDMIETKFLSQIPELIIEQNAKNTPMGKNLRVEEVIPTFEYLLSDGADLVTGQNIGVTGGVEIAR